jgi:hypothetical protein
MALGYVPIYNHSYRSNCEYEMDFDADAITIRSVRFISEGEELRTQLMALKKLARNTPINTVVLRRHIADSVIPLARYHLTKM